MLKKIDKSIWDKVKAQSVNENLECLVYTNNFEDAKQKLQQVLKSVKFTEYPFINALGIKTSIDNVKQIASINQVNYITSSTKVFAQMNVAKKIVGAEHLHKQNILGQNTTVCVIDTGCAPHIDLMCPSSRIVYFKDFVNGKTEPYDDNGHGTFITTCLAGNGCASGGEFCGIAPQCNIVSLKVLNKDGETGAFSVLEAMQWVFENKDKYNIKVVCMSFGSNPLDYADPLMIGAETLWNNGICVVCAAGNSGPNRATIKSPGISRKIITVGALDDCRDKQNNVFYQNFKVADFSSRGPSFNYYKPDVLAPGVNINAGSITDKLYTTMSGTSVATPIVAGLCALLKQKYPHLTPAEIKNILIHNCHPLKRERNSEGYGVIDFSYI